MRVLGLFSGVGGMELGLERAGFTIAAMCEIDPYCQAVLRKHWSIPIYPDVRTLPRIGGIFLVAAGFPCQPYSRAGKQLGAEDDRDLWPCTLATVRRELPHWVLCENTPGFIELGLDQALSDLEKADYSARAFVLPACAVNAWHRRDRVFLVAHSKWYEQPRKEPRDGKAGRVGREFQPFPWDRDWEVALREFRGMDDGSAYGVDRVDTLRNAVVPQLVEEIGRAILEQT
jgi:DNA (cytosine-5)-methyltransferase 1